MNLRSPFFPYVGGLAAVAIVAAAPANAQQGEDLGTLVDRSLQAMKTEDWKAAHEILSQAVDRYGRNEPLKLFGPQFGVLYYRKGICELKLRMYDEAAESFEICYREFPNTGEVAGGGNVYHKRALLKWGEAAMGQENWELAIQQFKKFLEERDPTRDSFPQGAFYVNMAVCHYKLGQIPAGNENLEIAINNRVRFPTPPSAIMAGFQALVGAAVDGHNEQALLDFIAKNRGELVLPPFEMQDFSPLLLKMGGEAVSADMLRAPLALYQLVPSTEVALADARARLASIGSRPGVKDGQRSIVRTKLEETIARLEKELRGPRAPESIKLAATAFVHEKAGNVRGAYASYELLERFHPTAEKREDYLYNLVRTASVVGQIKEAERYGRTFLADFPDSEHVPAVRRLMLSAMFYGGEYESCIEVASAMIDELEPGTKEHDICLHVLGGSYYYTGEYDKAQPLLDQHVEEYPESDMELAAQYFQASNLAKLQFWSKAARLLDAFFEEYPDPSKNIFYPFALLDRATAHFAEDQNEPALEKINRLIEEFPSSSIVEMAYNLKGNIHQTQGDLAAAEEAYLKALELAERRDNDVVAGEAIAYLVGLLGDPNPGRGREPRFEEAIPFIDKFWEEYGENSPYRSQVAANQVHALDAVGRGDEALSRLQDVIADMAAGGGSAGLEEVINTYAEIYLERKTPEELRDHFYNFPAIQASDRVARALLRIAVITVFEEVAKSATDPARKRDAEATLKVLFNELKTAFSPSDLSPYILVKLGDYLRQNTSAPREALPYYSEVLQRGDASYRFAALFGRGDIFARSEAAADREKAIEDFQRVYADSQNNQERELALFRIAETQMENGDFVAAGETARRYLDPEQHKFSRFKPEAALLLARSYDRRGDVDNALAMYTKVWSANMGYIAVSAPAMKRWMELSWQRNQPGDRQGAYEGGARYLELTARFKDRMSESDLGLWQEVDDLVKVYVADPNVKSLEQLAKEEAAR